jgi:hypothetical protein
LQFDALVMIGGLAPNAFSGKAHGAEAETMDGNVSADVEDAALGRRLINLRGIHGIGVLMVGRATESVD